jgi:hypothetical protein
MPRSAAFLEPRNQPTSRHGDRLGVEAVPFAPMCLHVGVDIVHKQAGPKCSGTPVRPDRGPTGEQLLCPRAGQ